jgi:MFS family permease
VVTEAVPTTDTVAPDGGSLRQRSFVVVVALQFAMIIAMGSAGIALPAVQSGLDASDGAIQWFAALFMLGFALVLVLGGRLGDIYGTRRLLLVGFGGFVLATLLGALAPTIGVVLLARLLQGVAGGIASPQLLATIQRTYTGDTRNRALAVFMTVAACAFMVGQLVTGALISSEALGLGWRWAFLVFLPLGVIAWPLAHRILPSPPHETRGRVDVLGAVVLAVASLFVLFPLIQGQGAGWPGWLLVMLVASIPASIVFVRIERRLVRRGEEPLVDPALFRLRTFSVGNIIGIVTGLLSFAGVVYVTLTLQNGFDRTALQAALLTAPIPFANMFGSLVAAPLLRAVGRFSIAVGAVLTAVSAGVLLAVINGSSQALEPLHLVPGLILLGFALGISISATIAITLADVPEASAGSASGVQSTVLQLASAIGIAVFGIVFFGVIDGVDTEGAYLDGLSAVLWLSVVLCVVQFLLSLFLPRHTRATVHPIAVADPENLVMPDLLGRHIPPEGARRP